jgi:hypothetical protein
MTKATQEELQAATNATLRGHATSDEAKALVARLAVMVDEHALAVGIRKNKRKKTADKLEYATGAFLANLLRALSDEAPEPNGWVYRSMHAKGFTGPGVSYRTFAQLVEGLKGLALVERVDGHLVSDEPGDTGKYAARFRATPALIRFCGEHGVEPTKALEHFEFEYDLPKEVVQLRARKVGSFYSDTKPTGRPMEFERTPIVEAIESNVRELNEFFAKQTLRGGSHEGYVRIFQNGDDPQFGWNKGGRLYSQHYNESYQVLSAEKRAAMTINGEQVAEIDIRASYLTIFLSFHGIQLDTHSDPYELEGLGASDRFAVKSWMVATFGNSKPIRRWPLRMLQKTPELKGHRAGAITKKAIAKYSALKSWGQPLNGRVLTWADLMWREGSIMIGTMLDLMWEHTVPSLTVHDSLIVPASKADLAAQRLAQRFHGATKVQPLLKINQSPHQKILSALRTIRTRIQGH